MRWNDIVDQFRIDIIDNTPVAKVDESGKVYVVPSDEFYRILEGFRAAGRREVRKCALRLAILFVLVLAGAWVVTAAMPDMWEAVRFVGLAFALGGSMYASEAFRRKSMAQHYYDHLEENFNLTAASMYANHMHYMVDEDGTILWDEPWDLENDFEGYLKHIEERFGLTDEERSE